MCSGCTAAVLMWCCAISWEILCCAIIIPCCFSDECANMLRHVPLAYSNGAAYGSHMQWLPLELGYMA